jgi:nicotinate phosphoribosyltransferase
MLEDGGDPGQSGLLTDLYQLTMIDAYLAGEMIETAVFEFFSRRVRKRSFLMAAGLEQLLDFLENLRFTGDEIAWLESTGRFSNKLLDYLSDFRFRGDVHAMPEGTVFFPDEPVVQVIAPLPDAQLVETRLINLIQFQSLIASKAARCVLAAPEKQLVDFGLRRAHGAEAGLLAARAAYIAGFAGTSNVLAEAEFGIPAYGTMAHSFILAHESEGEALEHFARAFPDRTTLLIDTYDTIEGARKATEVARKLQSEGIRIGGVRLDSGDMPALAVEVRKILDENGCEDVSIFCSGGLDEYALSRDYREAPVDGFGIGTHLDVSADSPYLNCAYKIQEYAGVPKRKTSEGKATVPARKQIYRKNDESGVITGDTLVEFSEQHPGRALLEPVMRDGHRVGPSPDLDEVRGYAESELASLPPSMRDPFEEVDYDVRVSGKLQSIADKIDEAH